MTSAGAGITTVTATWKALTSSMKVRVLPLARLPDGTTKWVMEELPGYRDGPIPQFIRPVQIGEDRPSMLWIEHEIAGSRLMLRAIDDVPRQLWIEAPAISARERIGEQLAGDDMGGGLLRVETTDGRSTSIVRVGRPLEGMPWRYTSSGRLGSELPISPAPWPWWRRLLTASRCWSGSTA